MDLLEHAESLSLSRPHAGLTALSLHGRLSRITRRDGFVLGYVERLDTTDAQPFVAKRLRPRAQGFVEVGRFWNADDAVDSLK